MTLNIKERVLAIADADKVSPINTQGDMITLEIHEVERLLKRVAAECEEICQKVAEDADAVANGPFVTGAGKTLHQGMWGGAKNAAAGIRARFGLSAEEENAQPG